MVNRPGITIYLSRRRVSQEPELLPWDSLTNELHRTRIYLRSSLHAHRPAKEELEIIGVEMLAGPDRRRWNCIEVHQGLFELRVSCHELL
jgi:hypothetical protein